MPLCSVVGDGALPAAGRCLTRIQSESGVADSPSRSQSLGRLRVLCVEPASLLSMLTAVPAAYETYQFLGQV